MKFIRRLLGRPADDDPAVHPWVDDRDEDDDADDVDEGGSAVERRYLEYVGGTSAKFYAIVLHGDDEAGWSVRFNFGRIGHPRDWGVKVEEVDEDEAREAFESVVAEKERGGYEMRPWPATLAMPPEVEGWSADDHEPDGTSDTLFVAAAPGVLPPAAGGRVDGVDLPAGVLVGPDGDDEAPVIWISRAPVRDVHRIWNDLVTRFPATGLWPLIMELEIEPEAMGEILIEPRPLGSRSAQSILAAWWDYSTDGDEEMLENVAPFGRRFPGLARVEPSAHRDIPFGAVAELRGHLGLVAVTRPADALAVTGWSGAANYDADPGEQSTVLRSWEDRFDAYLVGLAWDTVQLAVGRPARDRATARAIAAEHYAFCPDNVDQGVGSVKDYAEDLIDAPIWPFWWD